MAFRCVSHQSKTRSPIHVSFDLPWKNGARELGRPCVKCFKAFALCSRGPSGFASSAFGTDDDSSIFDASGWTPFVVIEGSFSVRGADVRLGDRSRGDASGLVAESMPLEVRPAFRSIFSHMQARCKVPKSGTTSTDESPMRVWRIPIAALP